jgi:hypothetical protein
MSYVESRARAIACVHSAAYGDLPATPAHASERARACQCALGVGRVDA